MLYLVLNNNFIYLFGVAAAFALTVAALMLFKEKLPHDKGRAFAVDGALSKGKARGAGLFLIGVLLLCDILFNDLSVERTVYLAVVAFSMISGYLDDASDRPWNEYLKGGIDLVLALIIAVNYLFYNGNTIFLGIIGEVTIEIPYLLFGSLIVILVWTAINVTNCTDGVDGLSSSVGIVTLGSFYMIMRSKAGIGDFTYTIMLCIVILCGYLWFNSHPSTILMGDAGSRALGVMIAIAALKSGSPLLYIPISAVMIIDGGLGLLKVALLRFFKIKILVNTRCPLHDHARKTLGWSDTQVCYRFVIIQLMVSLLTVWSYWLVR